MILFYGTLLIVVVLGLIALIFFVRENKRWIKQSEILREIAVTENRVFNQKEDLITLGPKPHRDDIKYKESYYLSLGTKYKKKKIHDGFIFMSFVFTGIMWLVFVGTASMITTINMIGKDLDIKYSDQQIEEIINQREQNLEILRDELSEEDYIALVNASTPEDIQFLAIRPGISEFLLGRANMLVEQNIKLFSLREQLILQRKDTCKMAENPFVPHIPFTARCPDLDLEELYGE